MNDGSALAESIRRKKMAENKIRIQDDLYMHVNQEWIDKAVIPDDRPCVGGFSELSKEVEELLIDEFNKLSSGELPCDDVYISRATKLYGIVKNTAKRNRDGIRPILKTLSTIDKLTGLTQFNRNLKSFVMSGMPLPFVLSVDDDMKDTKHHALFLFGPSVILPDTTYYKPEMEQQKQALLGVWSGMVAQLLAHTRLTEEEQAQYIQDALAFDAIIATLVKSQEEWSEYTKMYNPMTTRRVSGLLKPVKFRKLLTDIYGDNVPEKIIVAEPRYLNGFTTLFNEENFILYKHWAYVTCLVDNAGYLSEKLREIGSIYSRTLTGTAALPSIEKQAFRVISSVYSDPIGLYYGRKYFGEEAKKDVVEMVHEIIDTYKARVARNDFLSPETKEKAIVKLDKMEVKMGYPDKVDDKYYSTLVFDDGATLVGALAAIRAARRAHNFARLHIDVDRTEWVMPGHMVNACYNPSFNDITFPAAILQAPFYSIKQSRSENLGGIGAVIGHEISHAFDNNGAKCDENGNLNNWWTKEDFKKFKARTKAMIKQFDGIKLPQGEVNGTFVVSENIADNGGMAVTLEIMKGMPDADYKAYFYNWARIWCEKGRPEYLQLLLSVDVHSPAMLRANMPPRNFPEWYATFDVKRTDKMYIPESKRVVIW